MPAGLGDNICIVQMVKRLTASQLDEALSQIRRTGAIEQYKRARDEYQMHEAWQAAQKARNMQHEYGRLKEALSRLPIALQDPAMKRMNALGDSLESLRQNHPRNFPRGPSKSDTPEAREYRRLIS